MQITNTIRWIYHSRNRITLERETGASDPSHLKFIITEKRLRSHEPGGLEVVEPHKVPPHPVLLLSLFHKKTPEMDFPS